jgi:hypothetical protein
MVHRVRFDLDLKLFPAPQHPLTYQIVLGSRNGNVEGVRSQRLVGGLASAVNENQNRRRRRLRYITFNDSPDLRVLAPLLQIAHDGRPSLR